MSWNARIHLTEGRFLRPRHLQGADPDVETAMESRARHLDRYPSSFAVLEIDRDLARQSKFSLSRGDGIMPDGGLFDIPAAWILDRPELLFGLGAIREDRR